MPRSNPNNNAVKYTAAIVAVVAVAFCIGYFAIGGLRPTVSPSASIPPNIVPAAAPEPAKPAPQKIAEKVRTQNGEYSAPGAPNIRIKEDKNPTLVDTSKSQSQNADAQTTDSEASQQGSTNSSTSANTISPDGSTTSASSSGDNANTGSGTDNSTSAGQSSQPSSTDPDSETVSGSSTAQANSGGRAQFRVQAGSFIASENAKALAAVLKKEGYDTSTHAERDGNRTVYKVQVGAYRTRSAAEKAVNELLSSGYPASISPISP